MPYVLATPANASIERIAEIAPDVFWFQLYRFPYNDHAITFDLVRRADAAGAHVLVPDHRQRRQIEAAARHPQRREGPVPDQPMDRLPGADLAGLGDGAGKNGMLRTENIVPYAARSRPGTRRRGRCRCARGGSHTWDELARLRDRWKRAFVVKGVLHPQDAERAVALGVDGLIVSNHGGRHFDGAPASVDMLPAIVAAVGSRATVMIDSGIRGGLDVVRALALGAKFVLCRTLLRLWPRRARLRRRAARRRHVPRRDQDRTPPRRRALGRGGGHRQGAPPERLADRQLLTRTTKRSVPTC